MTLSNKTLDAQAVDSINNLYDLKSQEKKSCKNTRIKN